MNNYMDEKNIHICQIIYKLYIYCREFLKHFEKKTG